MTHRKHLDDPVSRRSFLLAGTLAGAAGLTGGCGFFTIAPRTVETPTAIEPGQKEAPMLAARVRSGALPPLRQRLPEKPLVITPKERPGDYGGTWRSGMLGAISIYQAYTYAATDALLNWDEAFTTPTPNIAEAVEVGEDGRLFTFRLRKGVRWSDGAPLTADDIVFAYDEVMSHKDLGGTPSPEFMVAGKAGKIAKVDDHTFTFRFAAPNGFFLARLASPNGYILTLYPKHYLTAFHKDHTPDVERKAADEGFSTWGDYFYSKVGRGYWDLPRWQSTELPTVACWVVKEPIGQGSRLVLERNPYYWKTDPQGRQLPYLDRVSLEVIGDAELMAVQVANGEMSYPQTDVMTLGNKPVLAANRERGGFRFVRCLTAEQNQVSLQLNLNAKDTGLREVFRQRDFRIALSKAIDRQEIIDAVYQRQGEPWQLAPRRESPFFDEELAKQHTELDLVGAQALLDGIGLTGRGDDGIRLLPDGRPLAFDMAVVTQQPEAISALNLVSQYWRKAGVRMRVQSMDRSLFNQRKGVNELTAAVWTAGGGLLDGLYDPRLWMPHNAECLWAPDWATWYTSGGAKGEEPPPQVKQQMELYDQISSTVGQPKQQALFKKILAIAKEEFFTIGLCLPVGAYTVVQNRFRNFPDDYIFNFTYPTPGPLHPEQFFLEAK
ncbi:ABC transporter substrate-binding protein [Nonomuraea angiospora]|uniref:ABC transporter substrate-binding protein n=1 Tax=Nonomuraea angiospora TaxID=46172 RepID=UPI003323FA0F